MAFCNPKEELSAILCNASVPPEWRDAIVRALSCVISLRRDDEGFCNGVKECETLTAFQPIVRVGNTLTFSYKDEKKVVHSRSVDLTTVINNLLTDVDVSCFMEQEDWEELTFPEKLNAIYEKACCVHGNCSGDGESGCGCEDCGDGEGPCIGTNACRCTQYTITGTAPYTFSYKDCDTKLLTEYESIDDNVVEICALKGSLILPLNTFSVEEGDCGITTSSTTTSSSTTSTTTEATTTTTTTSTSTTSTTTAAPATTTTTTSSTTTTTTAAPTTSSTTTTTSTTTSTSTTTTTTEAPTFLYYLADEYNCNDCVLWNQNILVRLPASHTVQVGKFYLPEIFVGLLYNILSEDPQTPGGAVPLTTNNYSTCGGACQ